MRLICAIEENDPNLNPYEFSYFLTTQSIENECELTNSAAGKPQIRIWITEEDDYQKALSLFEEYRANPHNPKYRRKDTDAIDKQESKLLDEDETAQVTEIKRRGFSPSPYGKMTSALLGLMIFLFIFALFKGGISIPPPYPGVIAAPVFPSFETRLLYDYPLYFEKRDELIKLAPQEDVKAKKTFSKEAAALYKEILATPLWVGLYDHIVQWAKREPLPDQFSGPLFEKIRKGQLWRVITPAFLHFNFLHIFFNLLWFILLANQIEYRIRPFRFLILLLVSACVTNTLQYLMTGFSFMGISGVISAMAGFIFARQQVAPWEGYLLNRLTLIFLFIFIVGVFFLQLVIFLQQIFSESSSFSGVFANTAHISGGIVGYLMGRMRFFSLRKLAK